MGWMWFVPAFHLADDATETTIHLTRKDVDFPLGVGAWIESVELVLTRVDNETIQTLDEPTSTRAGLTHEIIQEPASTVQVSSPDVASPSSNFQGGASNVSDGVRARDTLQNESPEARVLTSNEPPSRMLSPENDDQQTKGKGESDAGRLVHSLGRLMAGEGVKGAVHASQAAE